MKIILSRKGFDSGSGGVPSPIFPDGAMMSLPIPDKSSGIAYEDVAGNYWVSMGEAVSQLAGFPQAHRAHLDPDLVANSLPRKKGWRPIFGQVDAAEGHLRLQGVGESDIFLFFGLFRDVEKASSGWRFVRASKPIHSLFGWLQIADRVPVSAWPTSDRWALYHPHFARQPHPSNVIYTSTERLRLPSGECTGIAGAGSFSQFSPNLCLTAPPADRLGRWLLPEWFHPDGRRSVLTYHRDPARWERADGGVLLSSVSRGQEFVLDCDHYPEAVDWLKKLLSCA
jgi:hypothetical protein